MKLILIILVLGILAAGYVYYVKIFTANWEEKTISIDGHKLLVKIADTEAKREQGLQEVRKLGENEGMLFVFKKAKPVSMWNKNLRVNLDVLWVKNFEVVGIDSLPKIEGARTVNLDSPAGGADMVIEAPAGWVLQNGIRPGALILDI